MENKEIAFLAALFIAFVLYMAWFARRKPPVVPRPDPVALREQHLQDAELALIAAELAAEDAAAEVAKLQVRVARLTPKETS